MTTLLDTLPDRAATPLAALCALGLLWSLGSGTWFFLGGAETDVAPPVAAPTPRSAGDGASTLPAARIAALNLFGVASEEGPAVERLAAAPETRLQLELQGVFLADVPEQSSVIVAERNRDGRLYRIGDRLPGNAVLVEVFGDRIVLRRAGQLETLKFPDAAPGGAWLASESGTVGSDVRAAAAGASTNLPGAAGFGAADLGAAGDARSVAEREAERRGGSRAGAGGSLRDTLREYSERLNVDPTGTLAELGVEPVSQGGSGGYRLGNEIPSSTLAQVGLRPGDVVLSVNGQAVGDIQQDRSQLDAIMDAGSARLEIQRGERRFFVTTRIN